MGFSVIPGTGRFRDLDHTEKQGLEPDTKTSRRGRQIGRMTLGPRQNRDTRTRTPSPSESRAFPSVIQITFARLNPSYVPSIKTPYTPSWRNSEEQDNDPP
jgi:hypothetical protein